MTRVRVTLQDQPAAYEKVEVTIGEVAVHYVPKGDDDGDDGDGGTGATTDGGTVTDGGPASTPMADPLRAGWHVVLSEQRTYDLLTLKDNPTELGEIELGEGKLTQIRLVLAEGGRHQVTVGGVAHDLSVPSNTVKLVRPITLDGDATTTVKLDFDALESVRHQGDRYTLRPTIKLLD
jgi:hypothetical protein